MQLAIVALLSLSLQMLTKVTIKNFKKFDDVTVELGHRVVLIGPNNSGKTSTLQALALWDFGLREWIAKNYHNGSDKKYKKRTGVVLNRRELVPIPIPEASLLWKNKRAKKGSSKGATKTNIKIEIHVEGVSAGQQWECALEFDYANKETLYCRIIRESESEFQVPAEVLGLRVAYLPPMSGLAAVEPKVEKGYVNVLLGEGQTAQVLRNLCYQVYTEDVTKWNSLNSYLHDLFGVKLDAPLYLEGRGELVMGYTDENGVELDLSSSGRGFQQILLLLSYMYANPNTILLLDEPDAHLEILRQRHIYKILSDIAEEQKCQLITASHSEVILNEAADRDVVVAFVGRPHRIDDRGSQVLKSLKEIGFDQYYQAEQTGWVLYLEGSTDLAMLQRLAKKLDHPAQRVLDRPFVHYVYNKPSSAESHFYGLREAKSNLVGVGIFDRLDKNLPDHGALRLAMWDKRELENYFVDEQTLLDFIVRDLVTGDLFGTAEADRRQGIMREAIVRVSEALETLGKPAPWSDDIKVTDDFLDLVFARYYKELAQPNLMRKTDYHVLVDFYPTDKLDAEISRKLDLILTVADAAKPVQ